MVFQKPGGVSAALVLKGPLLVSTESHPVKSGICSEYRGSAGPSSLGSGWVAGALDSACCGPSPRERQSGQAEGRAQLAITRTFLAPKVSIPCEKIRIGWAGGALSTGPEEAPFPFPLPPSEWISNYADSVPDPEALRVEVDTFMEAYDKRIAEVGPPRGVWCHGCCGGAPEGDGRWHPVLVSV